VDLVLRPDGALAGHPGGGPYNVARTIGRLGGEVRYLGAISTDAFGARLLGGLEADGVDTRAVVATDAPTTLALAELDGEGGARYRFYVDGTSAPALEAGAVPGGTETFYLGTLGLVFEPLGTTLEALALGVADDVLLAIDPNCRPSAIADEAAYRSRLSRLLARADVVKVSDEDMAWLAPGEDPVRAARALGAPVALLTRGPAGAVVVTAGEAAEVPAPAVRVVDTIGAGDAFMGAFLSEWTGGRDLGDGAALAAATEFACRVAALACARPGADPPRRDELA